MQESKRVRIVPEWLLSLEETGYCVIPQVLDEAEIATTKDGFWTWIESFGTGINRNEPNTWSLKNWPPTTRGIIQHYGIGHAEFVWNVRSNPKVLEIFKTLWGTEELLSSFDGACLSIPRVDKSTQSWAHLDQDNRSAGKFICVQGVLTLTQAGPDFGGLIVYSGSHLLHKMFFDSFPDAHSKNNWCKLSDQHRQWYFERGCRQIQPAAPPGSLILWDSRTVHWAAVPVKGKIPYRMAVYACYTPRSLANRKQLERKQKIFNERRTTSHWPATNLKMFAPTPRTWGDEEILKKFTNRPTISDEYVLLHPNVKKLAGF